MDIHILGNGPSLNETDLSLLKTKDTISYNRAYIAYKDWGWYPKYYMLLDVFLFPIHPEYVENINNLIKNSPIKKFFIRDCVTSDGRTTKDFIISSDKVDFYKTQNAIYKFPTNKKKVYSYWGNVILASFQFMYEIGYRNFYLHGVDAQNLRSHFCDNYLENIHNRTTYKKAHFDRWLEFVECYEKAKREKKGIEIYLCCKNSKLFGYFPYCSDYKKIKN